MFRLWAKEWKSGHIVRDMVVEDPSGETRTHKVQHALTEVCRNFDLAEPMWLDKTISDFAHHRKCRFTQDNFIEEIPFDYLELEMLEEDLQI